MNGVERRSNIFRTRLTFRESSTFASKSKSMEYAFPDFPRIVVSQDICMGKPRIKGTRIPVGSVLAYLAGGMSVEAFLAEFHWVAREDVLQALAFSSSMMNDRLIPLERIAA